MLSTWTPDEPVAPTLLVKASDPIPGLTSIGDWTASWSLRHAAVEVPGSHLTILEDHADTTARVVEDWLVRHPRRVRCVNACGGCSGDVPTAGRTKRLPHDDGVHVSGAEYGCATVASVAAVALLVGGCGQSGDKSAGRDEPSAPTAK